MKKVLFSLALVAIIFSGCSKSSSNSIVSSDGSWVLGGTTYKAAAILYVPVTGGHATLSVGGAVSSTGTADGLSFTFATAPTSSGSLPIAATGAAGTVLVGASHLSGGSNATFYLNGVTSTKLNVSVSGGKVSVSFPGNIWVYNSTNPKDSLQLSISTLTQTN